MNSLRGIIAPVAVSDTTTAYDLFDKTIPVITLILGAVIARVGTLGNARNEAASQLAELRKRVWTKGGEEDWVDLQVALGKLRVALRRASVPERLVSSLLTAAEGHWSGVELRDDGEGIDIWGADNESVAALTHEEDRVLAWLDRPWHVIRRYRAYRAVSTQ